MTFQKCLRPVRIVISLIVLAGFFFVFSDVKAVIPSSIYNLLTGIQFLPSVLKFIGIPLLLSAGFVLIILITLLSGRVYCSTLCPLGIMQDAISFIQRKFFKKSKNRGRFKKALNYLRYPVLGIFIISLFMVGIFLINLLDPYANFGRIATHLYQPIFIAVNNLAAQLLNSLGIYMIHPLTMKAFQLPVFIFSTTLFTGILLMVIYRNRLYCNTICPVGTFLGLISKISIFKIKIEISSCNQCGKCQTACKSNCIDVKNMKVDESRCVACFNCIDSCKDSSIHYKNNWKTKKAAPKTQKTPNERRKFIQASLVLLSSQAVIAQNSKQNGHRKGQGNGRKHFFERGPITPPGSNSSEHLKDKCIACQLCISSCPTHVLQPSFLEYGVFGMMLPRLDNSKGFCNFECTKCSEVCPTGAIESITKDTKQTLQIGKVRFTKKHCIVHSEGTACGSCSEHCPTQAVKMVPYKGNLTIPETDEDICVGCGACEYACPVTDPHPAIFVVPNEVHQLADKPISKKLEVEETEDFPF